MNVLDLFSGIGAFSLGLERAGMRTVAFCEIDPYCRAVLAKHWPGVPIHGDVREIGAVECDVICGGFPCQDLSVAGQRRGLGGERSGLFFEIVRIVAEMREASNGAYPTLVLLENVPGLLSSNGGRDFAVVLQELAASGAMDIAWAILDAQWFGVAQQRRRVFVVADFGGCRAAEILSVPYGLPRNPPPSRETRTRVAATITSGVSASRGVNPPGRRREDDTNIVGVRCSGQGFWTEDDKTGPLRSRDAKGESQIITHALTSEGHDASEDGTGRGVPMIAFAIQERAVSENPENGPQGKGFQEGRAYTLEARHHQQAVAFAQNQRDEVREMHVAGALASEPGMKQQTYINRGGVRRLTPRECERLQGFPDDWTRYDDTGKEISDSARYRMLGNAVCVKVAEWIGRRLMESKRD